MQVKKQQLEPDMEQQTGFKLGKEYIKAVYCNSAYLTSMKCQDGWGYVPSLLFTWGQTKVEVHTEVSLYEPRMFLRDETH